MFNFFPNVHGHCSFKAGFGQLNFLFTFAKQNSQYIFSIIMYKCQQLNYIKKTEYRMFLLASGKNLVKTDLFLRWLKSQNK